MLYKNLVRVLVSNHKTIQKSFSRSTALVHIQVIACIWVIMKILVFSNIDFKLLGEKKKKSKFCKGLPSIAVLQP